MRQLWWRVPRGSLMVVSLVLLAGVAASAGCSAPSGPTCAPATGANVCTRILFLGNSYTYVNDLPGTFARLAQSGGHPVEVAMVANGGEMLSEHAASADSTGKIEEGSWTYVVLQEQSVTPALPGGRDQMYPAARQLDADIRKFGSTPMFFMTWGHSDGWPDGGIYDYATMQQAIDASYETIGHELSDPIAPVGFTWYLTRQHHPEISLWGSDGSHPSQAGTYLAACVFYASIFGQSPAGLDGLGLPDAQARELADEAATDVLSMKAEWGLK